MQKILTTSITIILLLLLVSCGTVVQREDGDKLGDNVAPAIANILWSPEETFYSCSPAVTYPLANLHFVATVIDKDDPADTLTYLWDFGDGCTTNEREPDHSYKYRNSQGFEVSLRVTDPYGAFSYLNIGKSGRRVIVMDGNYQPNISNLTASTITPDMNDVITLSVNGDDGDGAYNVGYTWYFQDGTTKTVPRTGGNNLSTVTHSYSVEALYDVRVEVFDEYGAIDSDTIMIGCGVNLPPVIGTVTWNPTTPTRDEAVNFSATASDPDGIVAAYQWTFFETNGIDILGSSSLQNPTFQYGHGGEFLIELRVIDDTGAITRKEFFIEVTGDWNA